MAVIANVGENRIAKNTSILLVAQVASRSLAIFYVAVLARYVGTEGIGLISTGTALAGLLILALAPGLDPYLIREVAAEPGKASEYVSNMLGLRLALGIPFVILVVIVSNTAGYSTNAVQIIYVYAAVYFFDNLGEIFTSFFRARQRMEYEAGTQVLRDVVNFSLSLSAIYLRWSLLAIVLMSLVAQSCKLLLLVVLSHRHLSRPTLPVHLKTMMTLFVASLTFGGLVVLYTIQNQLGIFALSLFHAPGTVGVFTAANTLIATLILVPGALSVALYPAFSKLAVQSPSELRHYYALSFKYLAIFGSALGVGTILVADRVILLIYGEGFEQAVGVLRVMAIFLVTFVTYCNGPLLNATGRERFFALTLSLGVCGYGLLCLLMIPTWGPMGAALASVATGVATTALYSIKCHRILGLSLPWMTMGKVAVATGIMGLVTWLMLEAGVNWLVVTLAIAPSCYVVVLVLIGLLRREELAWVGRVRTFSA